MPPWSCIPPSCASALRRIRLSAAGFVLAFLSLAPSTYGVESAPTVDATVGTADDQQETTLVPKFELDIMPILTAHGCNMGACHGKARGQNGFALSLLGYDIDFDYHAIVRQGRGRRVFPADPVQSLFLQKGAGELPHGGGIRLPTDSEAYQTVARWISHGMPRADASDPVFQSIKISPPARTLHAEEHLPLKVTAHYSDGSTRDVTETSYFQSSDTVIASVNDRGELTAGRLPGEATVMARYMGQIATWDAAIAYQGEVSEQQYQQLLRVNFIDDLVYEKLQTLNVLPSQPIADDKFLRRVYLDLIGRLPTAEEAAEFLGDQDSQKRQYVVDALLERPEYADFWANKWADLLRPNPYRVGIKATQSLDDWIRDAFRRNLSFDEFVSQLVTAQGSTWRNGAVTVFRDRRTPEEITTMFSQLFMGVRLDCARCHQHPFEVYGQDDFFSLAAYFSKVGYKGKGLSPPISGGEETVFVKESGDVRHPLTGETMQARPLWGDRSVTAEHPDPRVSFARWLTGLDNQRFAEAAANRVWGELFGVGIVDPVDDIRATNPPSNSALLTALGEEFQRVGFDQKQLLKTITMSATYALSSLPNQTNADDHRNFSRRYRRPLRAEVIADAIADVTGVTDRIDGMPPESRTMQMWTFRARSETLDAFGRPDPNQDPPCERLPESTMGQALHLMNAPQLQSKLADSAGLAARLAASDSTALELIRAVYLTVYSRYPTNQEVAVLEPLFEEPERSRQLILEDLLWSLLNTPEFTHVD